MGVNKARYKGKGVSNMFKAEDEFHSFSLEAFQLSHSVAVISTIKQSKPPIQQRSVYFNPEF